jgi:hypothetical protein
MPTRDGDKEGNKMTSKEHVITQPALDLPKFRTEDWMRYLDSLFEIPATEIAQGLNMRHPELLTALAFFNRDKGLDTERMQGFFMGIALMQFMWLQGYLKVSAPPPMMKIQGQDVIME